MLAENCWCLSAGFRTTDDARVPLEGWSARSSGSSNRIPRGLLRPWHAGQDFPTCVSARHILRKLRASSLLDALPACCSMLTRRIFHDGCIAYQDPRYFLGRPFSDILRPSCRSARRRSGYRSAEAWECPNMLTKLRRWRYGPGNVVM